MSSTKKQLLSKERSLKLEQLEDRRLFTVAPATTPPPLEATNSPPPLESPFLTPLVYAGQDLSVNLGESATLFGEVINNTINSVTIDWNVVSGPGSVTFGNLGSPITDAAFSAPGVYELELLVDNGVASAADRVQITVDAPASLPDGLVLYLGDEMQFTGNNDHVVVSHNDAYLLDSGSVAFWFKADNTSVKQGLFSKDSSGYDDGGHLSVHLEADAKINLRLQSTTGTISLFSNNTVNADTWHHVAVNFGSGGLQLYLDGVLEQSNGYSGGLGTSSGGAGNFEPIVLGASGWGSDDLLATPIDIPLQGGSIDDVIIVDHALSTQEIADLVAGNHTSPAPPVASNASITATTGQTYNGTATATDPNSDPLTYQLVAQASNGTAVVNPDGSFTYTPNGGFLGPDSFTFRANDGTFDSNVATVSISVQQPNSEEVLATNNPLSVAEGAAGTITSSLLMTTDSDNTPAELTYTITGGPNNGTLLRAGSAATSFTQADVNAGLVAYQHDGGETTNDSFAFLVDDGQGSNTVGVFDVIVTPVNDEESVSSNNTLSVQPGGTATISASELTTSDPDNSAAEIIYTVTSGPSNGTLLLAGSAATNFTQADIDAGLVTYQHSGSSPGADSFTFTVNDGQGTVTNDTFSISIADPTQFAFSDSFEGGGTSGWDPSWNVTGAGGTLNSGLQTVTEVTPPPGGGSHALRQWWHANVDNGYSPEWPRYFFDNPDDGAILEFEFYLMYDANFNFGSSSPTLKGIRLWDTQHTWAAMDLNTHHQGDGFAFELYTPGEQYFHRANVNGGAYHVPAGQWVHYRFQMKKATYNQGPENGYIHGWIDGVQRWKYDNIYTCAQGKNWGYLEMNPTFNQGNLGPNNKRYWDSFALTITPPASATSLATLGNTNPGVSSGSGSHYTSFLTTPQVDQQNANSAVPVAVESGTLPLTTYVVNHTSPILDVNDPSQVEAALSLDDASEDPISALDEIWRDVGLGQLPWQNLADSLN